MWVIRRVQVNSLSFFFHLL